MGCYRPIESGLGHFQAGTALTMASTPRIFQRAAQIVNERRHAELGSDILQPSHEKGALVHPYVDGPLLASCWAVL
jgi:hypothetical protein